MRVRIPAGMFLVSSAALMYEISLSRLLAIELWNHYAFLIISGALLGYGAAGAFRLSSSRRIPPLLPVLCFSLLLIPLFLLSSHLPFDPALMALDPRHGVWLLLIFLLLAFPFFLAGLTLNLLLEAYTEHAHFLYASDLIGAACGCAGFFLTAPWLTEIEGLGIPALLAACSSLCLASGKKQNVLALVTLLTLFCGSFWLGKLELRISDYKNLPHALRYPGSKLLETQRDASVRIDWLETPLARFAPGLSLEFRGSLPDQLGLTLDADGLTGVAPLVPDSLGSYLRHLPEWVLYFKQSPPENVLVLKTLGGQQALAAVEAGTSSVLVQTPYPLLTERLAEDSRFPQIEFRATEARALLAEDCPEPCQKPEQNFDRILVAIESSAPVGSTGMDPLKTDQLMSLEGMQSLLNRLPPGGWLAVHRFLLPPPRGEMRLLATVITAMRRQGWKPDQRLGVFRTLSTLMVLVSREAWTPKESSRFREFCLSRGFAPVYYPDMPETERNSVIQLQEPVYAQGVRELLADPPAFHARTPFDLQPVTDDRPYFELFLDWNRLDDIRKSLGGKWEGLVEAGLLVPLLFAAVSLSALLLIGIPILPHLRRMENTISVLLYFAGIGLAFMLVEIALLEKLTPFLGQPVYSFALVLSGLLTASGLGSFLSSRFSRTGIRFYFLLLLFGLFFCFRNLPDLLRELSGEEWIIRLLWAWLVVSASGLLMGIPFPAGLKHFAVFGKHTEERRIRVAMAWCANACASVAGAAGAVWIAQLAGQSILFLLGALAYGTAWLTLEIRGG